MAGVRSLIDDALASDRSVTLLFGAASAMEVYPSSLLPDQVEYVVSTDDGSFGHHGRVTELVPQYEAWADQCFACGPQPMLAAMAQLAASRQQRLGVARLGPRRGRGTKAPPLGSRQARRRSWLQVSMEQNMGCAVGACLGCVIMGTEGPQRVCREGPVFAAEEVAWEGWR
jgi:dihydroorotate dehydrogenase electron transfer subunit